MGSGRADSQPWIGLTSEVSPEPLGSSLSQQLLLTVWRWLLPFTCAGHLSLEASHQGCSEGTGRNTLMTNSQGMHSLLNLSLSLHL